MYQWSAWSVVICLEASVPFRQSYLLISSHNLKHTGGTEQSTEILFHLTKVFWVFKASQRRRRALTLQKQQQH